MKIDFTRLELKGIDGAPLQDGNGQPVTVDISKVLGNYIYNETRDLGELELAQRVYKVGAVDLTPDEINVLGGYVKAAFKAVVQQSFNELTGYGKQTGL